MDEVWILVGSLTFISLHQCDLKAVPPRFLWIEHHLKFRVRSSKCLTHTFCIPPVDSSAFTVNQIYNTVKGQYLPPASNFKGQFYPFERVSFS